MANSSLRNAVKRITHKERAQPQARKHLGLLEKHGDYKKRAVHHHAQKSKILGLRRKATMRNPDEFYMGMNRAQVHAKRGHQLTAVAKAQQLEDTVGAEAVRVMKSQDLAYVRLQKQRDMHKAQRLQESLHLLDDSSEKKKKNVHTIFVTSKREANRFTVARHFDTAPELMSRSFNRPRLSQIIQQQQQQQEQQAKDTTITTTTTKDKKRDEKQQRRLALQASKARVAAYAELEARLKRSKAMARAEAHLMTEKLVSGKGRKRKISNDNNNNNGAAAGQPSQYKWRRKRNK
jgi:U3 small nucleolar RNA-associated protein 11